MKITAIANLSANGKVLLAGNPNHKSPKAGEEFFIQKVVEQGNIVIGRKTFEVIKELAGGEENINYIFPKVEIVIFSSADKISEKYKSFKNSEAIIEYLSNKGFKEIIIGGGTKVYNTFLEKNLLTDLYFTYVPVITGNGGVLGSDGDLFTEFNLVEQKLLSDNMVQLHLSKENTKPN